MIYKKFRSKWLVKKSKFVWRKKNSPRAQIFRYLFLNRKSEQKGCTKITENQKMLFKSEMKTTSFFHLNSLKLHPYIQQSIY